MINQEVAKELFAAMRGAPKERTVSGKLVQLLLDDSENPTPTKTVGTRSKVQRHVVYNGGGTWSAYVTAHLD